MALLNTPTTPPRPPSHGPASRRDNHHQDTMPLLRSAECGNNDSSADALIMLARSTSTTGWYRNTALPPNQRAASCSLDDRLILLAHSHSTLEGQHNSIEAQGQTESRYLDKVMLEPGGGSSMDCSTADFDSLGETITGSNSDDDVSRNSLLDDYDEDSILSMVSSMVDVEPPMRLSRMCSCFGA